MVTDEMVEKACVAYWGDKNMTSMFKGKTREGIAKSMRAALEAALSAAEPVQTDTDGHKQLQAADNTKPVAWVYALDLEKGDGCFGNAKGEVCMSRDGKWIKVDTPLYAAPPALSAQVQDVATHRHKKRGTEYVLIGVGKMQAENWRELVGEQYLIEGEEVGTAVDMREVAIYRSVDDGSLWVRPVEEFSDGRFETLPAAPAKQEGKP